MGNAMITQTPLTRSVRLSELSMRVVALILALNVNIMSHTRNLLDITLYF